jgi:hypothetical protein
MRDRAPKSPTWATMLNGESWMKKTKQALLWVTQKKLGFSTDMCRTHTLTTYREQDKRRWMYETHRFGPATQNKVCQSRKHHTLLSSNAIYAPGLILFDIYCIIIIFFVVCIHICNKRMCCTRRWRFRFYRLGASCSRQGPTLCIEIATTRDATIINDRGRRACIRTLKVILM